MTTLTLNDLRITNAKNLVTYIDENPSYMFIGRATPWESDIQTSTARSTAGDNSPPYPDNNWQDFYRIWDQMLSLNRVQNEEVFHMIPRFNWTSGVVYDMYRHDYSEDNKSYSNASNLYNSVYYVLSQNNNVYVCLDNNFEGASNIEPLTITDEPFYTSDGYQWLRLYEVDYTTLITYGTNNFIPITDTNVNQLGDGKIFTVIVDSRGDEYTSAPRGDVDFNPYYFCNITGDGVGAVARVGVSGGKIFEVKVARSGEGYTYGNLDFRPNYVYRSLSDLDEKKNGLNPQGDGSFRSTVIICPPGGWGDDLVRQLVSTRVGIFSDFTSKNMDYVVESEFRQVGIVSELEDYTIENENTGEIIHPESLSAVYAVVVKEVTGSRNDRYQLYETITQTRIDEQDPNIREVAKGMVVGWDDEKNIIRYIQDPHIHSDIDGHLYRFTGKDKIIGETSEKESIPNINIGQISVGRPNGVELDDMTFKNGYAEPEVKKYSGIMTYVTNVGPVKRSPEQTERVSLIVSY